MADFRVQETAARVGASAPSPARLGRHGQIVPIPLLMALTLEGRVFTAGHGIEETATSNVASGTFDEQKPMFHLRAPTGGTIVVPISVTVRMHAEGGAAPVIRFAYVQADRIAAGSGTSQEATILSCMGGTQIRRAQAILEHTVTSTTAITNDENVALMTRDSMLDNIISAEMIAADSAIETPSRGTLEWVYEPIVPFMLYKGSALAAWSNTNTSSSTWSMVWQWAELDAGKYLPDHLL